MSKHPTKEQSARVDLGRFPLGLDTGLDQHEVGELLHVQDRTLGDWRRSGNGPPFYRIGVRPMYRLGDLIDWQRSRVRLSTLEDQECSDARR